MQIVYGRIVKRFLDVLLGALVLCAVSPLLLVISIAVGVTSKGPVLFKQERLGRHGRIFVALKFRTMVNSSRTPSLIAVRSDDQDVTRVGRILRRFKLDELPQLVNVVAGDMSLIGPRPQLPIQLAEFTEIAKIRLEVRPGLTGMAQTHGNTALTWPERWYYDAFYVRNLSLKLDCRLMWRTLLVLLHGEEKYLEHPPLESSEIARV